ncbi:MAG TPA: DUF4242 domain-containing protein [Anaerolineales bacterium]|nr:DUF4242 domain-containing protein [Anaerolineales bacterium]
MNVVHRYLIERTFGADVKINLPGSQDPTEKHLAFAANNTHERVVWVHSYVSPDGAKTFCIYDAPDPEAIRRASMRNNLPIDRITEVSILSAEFRDPGGHDSDNIVQAE